MKFTSLEKDDQYLNLKLNIKVQEETQEPSDFTVTDKVVYALDFNNHLDVNNFLDEFKTERSKAKARESLGIKELLEITETITQEIDLSSYLKSISQVTGSLDTSINRVLTVQVGTLKYLIGAIALIEPPTPIILDSNNYDDVNNIKKIYISSVENTKVYYQITNLSTQQIGSVLLYTNVVNLPIIDNLVTLYKVVAWSVLNGLTCKVNAEAIISVAAKVHTPTISKQTGITLNRWISADCDNGSIVCNLTYNNNITPITYTNNTLIKSIKSGHLYTFYATSSTLRQSNSVSYQFNELLLAPIVSLKVYGDVQQRKLTFSNPNAENIGDLWIDEIKTSTVNINNNGTYYGIIKHADFYNSSPTSETFNDSIPNVIINVLQSDGRYSERAYVTLNFGGSLYTTKEYSYDNINWISIPSTNSLKNLEEIVDRTIYCRNTRSGFNSGSGEKSFEVRHLRKPTCTVADTPNEYKNTRSVTFDLGNNPDGTYLEIYTDGTWVKYSRLTLSFSVNGSRTKTISYRTNCEGWYPSHTDLWDNTITLNLNKALYWIVVDTTLPTLSDVVNTSSAGLYTSWPLTYTVSLKTLNLHIYFIGATRLNHAIDPKSSLDLFNSTGMNTTTTTLNGYTYYIHDFGTQSIIRSSITYNLS